MATAEVLAVTESWRESERGLSTIPLCSTGSAEQWLSDDNLRFRLSCIAQAWVLRCSHKEVGNCKIVPFFLRLARIFSERLAFCIPANGVTYHVANFMDCDCLFDSHYSRVLAVISTLIADRNKFFFV